MTNWATYPVTHGYITSYQGPNTDTPHWAEDIGTPFHTPLTAPLAGTVKIADYQAWGGQIFIQPDDKSFPEYYMYHPDELDVKAGQHVDAGQLIGLSGGENPGYPGAEHPAQTKFSSGPHTHIGWFEQYRMTPIGTEPFGPDPSNLLEIAKGETPGLTPLGDIQSQSQSGACQQPTGVNALNPLAWSQYWGCQAGNTAAGDVQKATSGVASWIQGSIGGFALRVGVGIAGLMLMRAGIDEIVAAMRGESVEQSKEDVLGAIPVIGDDLKEEKAKINRVEKGNRGDAKEEPSSEKKPADSKEKSEPAAKKPMKSKARPKEATSAAKSKAADSAAELAAVA